MSQVLNPALLNEFDREKMPQNGLPSAAYTNHSFLELENSYLFSRNWVFTGFAHQLPNIGDVTPVSVAGQPILIVRNESNEITAFHNVCRHRSLQMVDKPGNCGRKLRCPYHSWSYDLHGKLKNAPFFGGAARQQVEGFEFEDNGLIPVNCAIWHDWIFINLDPEPETFESFLEPVKQALGDTDITRYHPIATIDLGEIRCNWKLLMENFIEPYHVQFVRSEGRRLGKEGITRSSPLH